MEKLIVNTEGCIGCGACVGIDEEHFDFNEDNLSYAKSQKNLSTVALQDAIAACPVSVISLVSDTEENACTCQTPHENCHCETCQCDDENEEAA